MRAGFFRSWRETLRVGLGVLRVGWEWGGGFDEEIVEIDSGKDFRDFYGSGSVAVGVFDSGEGGAEFWGERFLDGGENFFAERWDVDDVGCAFPALLTDADVDDGEGEGGGFHDSAG